MDRKQQPTSGHPGPETGTTNIGPAAQTLSFDGFRLEADGTLLRGDTVVHLPPQELAALRLLLAHAGHIVTPAQLKHALWGDVHVSADSIPKCLSSLRNRLKPHDCIQTVYKRGYRLMAKVVAQLRPVQPQAPPTPPRLAIPPFFTEPGVPPHLGPAIAEDAIARLSNASHPSAAVLARDSVFTLAGQGLTAQQIGERLHADLVLAGTLRSFTPHFRLRVEMIRVADGVQIWVEDLIVLRDRTASLESALARRLAFRLKQRGVHPSAPSSSPSSTGNPSSSSPGAESAPSGTAPSNDPLTQAQRREAYDTFVRGHQEWQSLERHRMQDGLQYLAQATQLDPSLITAKIDLVRLCVTQSIYGYLPPSVAANLLYRTAESIPDMPQTAAEVLPSIGWANFHFDHNLPAALRAFALSAHLPHNTWTTRERTHFALSRYRFEEAISISRDALDQDPFAPWLHGRLAWTYHLAGQSAESLRLARQAVATFPDHDGVAYYAAIILAANGEVAEALKLAEAVARRQPHLDLAKAIQAYTLACAGRPEEARAILDRLQWLSRERFVLAAFTPAVHVALGDLDAALAALESSYTVRCPWFFQMLADPRLKPLHGHPAFEQLRAILPRLEQSAQNPEQN